MRKQNRVIELDTSNHFLLLLSHHILLESVGKTCKNLRRLKSKRKEKLLL